MTRADAEAVAVQKSEHGGPAVPSPPMTRADLDSLADRLLALGQRRVVGPASVAACRDLVRAAHLARGLACLPDGESIVARILGDGSAAAAPARTAGPHPG
jgi:hypothetical protein